MTEMFYQRHIAGTARLMVLTCSVHWQIKALYFPKAPKNFPKVALSDVLGQFLNDYLKIPSA